MQFLDFREPRIPDCILEKQYPPLYCMHSAILASGTNGQLNFNYACKILILNNIEGLTNQPISEPESLRIASPWTEVEWL
jgi:hypothetical protein